MKRLIVLIFLTFQLTAYSQQSKVDIAEQINQNNIAINNLGKLHTTLGVLGLVGSGIPFIITLIDGVNATKGPQKEHFIILGGTAAGVVLSAFEIKIGIDLKKFKLQ